jgi:hypothetical protein
VAGGYRFREKFEPNQGYHFFCDRTSVLLRAMSFGRRLADEQTANYTREVNQFLDSIDSVDAQSSLAKPLVESDFADLNDEPIYKYVSDATWQHISAGSFQFGTAQFYRETPNISARDRHEGASTFHLTHGNDQLNISIVSGSNCALFCGTSFLDGADHALMAAKFGQKTIIIHPLRDFISIARRQLRAFSARTHNVVYTDLKNYTAEFPELPKFAEIMNSGDTSKLEKRSLRKINERFFSTFYRFGLMPSLFSKPTSYSEEKERRIVFETLADLRTPTVIVNDKSFLDCVRLVDRG